MKEEVLFTMHPHACPIEIRNWAALDLTLGNEYKLCPGAPERYTIIEEVFIDIEENRPVSLLAVVAVISLVIAAWAILWEIFGLIHFT